jgi:poly[(R)-3-hydroxyalkanoate] polymerase subunit PhaC
MHSEYLRKLFLDNDLAEGRFKVDGRAISIGDIRVPMFVVSTTRDHVAPWRSVYQIHLLADSPVTFVLATGGHNGGIVSEPGHAHRSYRVATRRGEDTFVEAESWAATASQREGSWWLTWSDWLAQHSDGERDLSLNGGNGRLAPLPEPLCDAPGTYVHER